MSLTELSNSYLKYGIYFILNMQIRRDRWTLMDLTPNSKTINEVALGIVMRKYLLSIGSFLDLSFKNSERQKLMGLRSCSMGIVKSQRWTKSGEVPWWFSNGWQNQEYPFIKKQVYHYEFFFEYIFINIWRYLWECCNCWWYIEWKSRFETNGGGVGVDAQENSRMFISF